MTLKKLNKDVEKENVVENKMVKKFLDEQWGETAWEVNDEYWERTSEY